MREILSKVYNPADLDPELLGAMHTTDILQVLPIVDRFFECASPQHISRKWEYAMALAARRVWLQWDYEQHGHANRAHGHLIYDVGGAGSPLHMMLADDAGAPARVIDPAAEGGFTLEQFLRWRGQMAHEVYCVSVIEHVDDLGQFLYHLSCVVAPGGLLFLTTDYWDRYGEDKAHWHWMRKRIFNSETMKGVMRAFDDFQLLGDQPWGTFDDRWHGPIENWGYAPASLALVKRR